MFSCSILLEIDAVNALNLEPQVLTFLSIYADRVRSLVASKHRTPRTNGSRMGADERPYCHPSLSGSLLSCPQLNYVRVAFRDLLDLFVLGLVCICSPWNPRCIHSRHRHRPWPSRPLERVGAARSYGIPQQGLQGLFVPEIGSYTSVRASGCLFKPGLMCLLVFFFENGKCSVCCLQTSCGVWRDDNWYVPSFFLCARRMDVLSALSS